MEKYPTHALTSHAVWRTKSQGEFEETERGSAPAAARPRGRAHFSAAPGAPSSAPSKVGAARPRGVARGRGRGWAAPRPRGCGREGRELSAAPGECAAGPGQLRAASLGCRAAPHPRAPQKQTLSSGNQLLHSLHPTSHTLD